MNRSQSPPHIHIRQMPRRIVSPRLIPPIVAGIVTVAAWRIVPPDAVIWVLLPLVVAITWVASYGWKKAIHAIHILLDRLEQLN